MTAPVTHMFGTLCRYGLAEARKRVGERINVRGPGECWEYLGAVFSNGYGRLKFGRDERFLAHRIAWALEHNREPGELLVCHSCDNRRCCNPAHLFLGTALDNTRDMAAKGRRAKQSGPRNRRRGPKLTAEDAAQIRSSSIDSAMIAKTFGISLAHARRIRAGRSWTSESRASRRARRNHVPTINQPRGD